MKSRNSLLRLKQFQVSEKHRQVLQIETMIKEFQRMADDLQKQIETEERKSGITDVKNFAYPTFAKAARTRCENLEGSIKDLHSQLQVAESALADAEAELKKAEMLEVRDSRPVEVEPQAPDPRVMIG
ncbi:MAG: flagellar FliJ family protein [Pseudomonadota bacterium]